MQTRYSDNAYASLASGVTPANPNVSQYMRDLHGSAAQLYQMVVFNATAISYDMVLRLCGIIFVLSIPLVMLRNWRKTAGDRPAAAAPAD